MSKATKQQVIDYLKEDFGADCSDYEPECAGCWATRIVEVMESPD